MPSSSTKSKTPDGRKKTKVFISYSRSDSRFVDGLQEALERHDIDVLVDREDIEKGEAWWTRIKQLILESDSVVFVLSPDSTASKTCQDEVDFAESLNKRFLPIVAREIEGEAPAALARLNYIFFTRAPQPGGSPFDSGVAELVRALETDIGWIREHTRLGELAERWMSLERRDDLLLRGSSLSAAETWLTTRPPDAPIPTDAHRAFLTESRRAATRRQRQAISLAVAAIVVSLSLAAAALWQRAVAIENERRAEERSALLSAGAARELSSGGATNAALALLLKTASTFEDQTPPDQLLIGFEEAISAARQRESHRFSPLSTAVYLNDGYYVFDPARGRVTRIDAGGARDVAAHSGAVYSAALVAGKSGLLIVNRDLTVSKLDLRTGSEQSVGRITWQGEPRQPGARDTIVIGDDLVVLQSDSRDADQTAAIFGVASGKTVTTSLDYAARLFIVPGSDAGGRRFVVDGHTGAVLAINRAFSEIARSSGDDKRWQPGLGCERGSPASGGGAELLKSLPMDELVAIRRCLRVSPSQALNVDAARTSAGLEYTFTYFETGAEALSITPHLTALLGRSNDFDLYEESDLGFVDFLPGGTLLAASYNRDVFLFDRDSIHRKVRLRVPPESAGFLSGTAFAIVERLGDGLEVTVLKLPDESAETASVESDPPTPSTAPQRGERTLHGGTCTGYNLFDERKLALADGGVVTLAANNPANIPNKNELAVESGGQTRRVALPGREISCVEVSADRQRMLIASPGRVAVYDLAAILKGKAPAESEIATIEAADIGTAAFFAGPDNDVVGNSWSGEVLRWRIAGGRVSAPQVLYRGTKPVRYAEPDGDGKRLLILEDIGSGVIRGFLYSVDAQREWRSLGSEYKHFSVAFLSDREVGYGAGDGWTTADIPSLSDSVRQAEAAWSSFCRVTDGSDVATSPCWPAELR